jgi:hypothetical protein
MENRRFDAIARQVAGLPQSRRATLRLLAGSLAGAVLGGVGLRATPAEACLCQPPLSCCFGPPKCQDGICSTGAPYCANLQTDNRNCGQCGKVCPSGTTCQSGGCRCPSGLTLCGGLCVDLQTNTNHCGSCGRYCGRCGRYAPRNKCVAGVCEECTDGSWDVLKRNQKGKRRKSRKA